MKLVFPWDDLGVVDSKILFRSEVHLRGSFLISGNLVNRCCVTWAALPTQRSDQPPNEVY